MDLQLVWVKFMVPETKGVPLEKIEYQLTGTRIPEAVSAAAATAVPRVAQEGWLS